MPTLAARFDPRRNSLNALRLVLASLVIVSHSWPLSGREPEPALGGANLGTWAVFGFFGISGFLITRSRLSGAPASVYYRARFLRIMPAFIVALVVVAFAFAPLSQMIDPEAHWRPMSSITFVLRNLLLYPPYLGQPGILDTLTTTPFAYLWNGPLWTLFWEAACYVLIGVAVSLIPRRRLALAVTVLFAVLTAVSLAGALGAIPMPELAGRVIPMIVAFLGGSLVLLFADRIRLSPLVVSVAVLALALVTALGLTSSLGTLFLGFLLVALSTVLPLAAVGSRFDISYGMYIYGWPVQQFVILAVGQELPLPLYLLLVFAGTIPLAFLSCVLVERPALALKRRSPRLQAPAPESA